MLVVVTLCFALYCLIVAAYRLFLSPIASFPGPRLAALTFWYEFYYDVVLKGKYAWKIQDMHKRYGPIVRINPEELHINDPTFYDQVYVVRRTNKWHWSAQMFGTDMAAVGTVDHDLHHQRRAALKPFFSPNSVSQIEPKIRKQVGKLCEKLGNLKGSGQVANLSNAFACLSADIISDCAFGEAYGLLDSSDFAPDWRKFMMELSLGTHLMKQFGWAYRLIMGVAPWLLTFLHPLSRELDRLRQNLKNQIEDIRSSPEPDDDQMTKTLFHELLNGDLPDPEKSTARLTDEALTIIGAGTVTTAHTLALTMFHIMSNASILRELQDELLKVWTGNDSVTWNTLTQLDYLSAVIKEGLRLAFGVSHRLQRISPDTDLHYNEWTIPAGTPVSQTQMFIMTDPSLFPLPHEFIPRRWLPGKVPDGFPTVSDAKKFFIPFSRGARACVGMNLAYAELFLTIGSLLRPVNAGGRFEMELFQTTRREFDVAYDWFNPCPALDAKGLRILVR